MMEGSKATIAKLPPEKRKEIPLAPEKKVSDEYEEDDWMNGNNPLLEPIPMSLTLEKAKGGLEVVKSKDWKSDDVANVCSQCQAEFHALNRRHHCRLCGNIFCNDCSSQRALVPPSSIVLEPKGGKKVSSDQRNGKNMGEVSFEGNADPDRTLTYMQAEYGESTDKKKLLYGKGLEERTKLAREPLRVCSSCYRQLQSVQNELRNCNSNAMRYNAIDPTDVRRLFNSPLAFTLGHEIRKVSFSPNNSFVPIENNKSTFLKFRCFLIKKLKKNVFAALKS